ncbi:MAG TPA: hypothetical protein VHQ45_19930, partial [Gemmatimonadaceae bacterium]|nr:hypothetical protein [Gemmatimonadaceae bacterium]
MLDHHVAEQRDDEQEEDVLPEAHQQGQRRERERGERIRAGVRWAVFLAAAVLAGCVSPYGYRAMLVTVTLFGSGESLPFIREWQPLALDLDGTIAIAALAFATLAL